MSMSKGSQESRDRTNRRSQNHGEDGHMLLRRPKETRRQEEAASSEAEPRVLISRCGGALGWRRRADVKRGFAKQPRHIGAKKRFPAYPDICSKALRSGVSRRTVYAIHGHDRGRSDSTAKSGYGMWCGSCGGYQKVSAFVEFNLRC